MFYINNGITFDAKHVKNRCSTCPQAATVHKIAKKQFLILWVCNLDYVLMEQSAVLTSMMQATVFRYIMIGKI